MTRETLNLSELPDFASTLARDLRPGMAVLLRGPLGAGKTTLARALIAALADNAIEVQSPTFPLCLTYDTPRGTIWHYDLYRLSDNAPLDDLGWFEARQSGIAIVEWPERMNARDLHPPYIAITLNHTDDDDRRLVSLERKDA